MHQIHLPKLDDLGITTYDADAKQVSLEDQADDDYVYMETVSKYELTWSELHLGLAILGIVTSAGGTLGTPFLTRFSSLG